MYPCAPLDRIQVRNTSYSVLTSSRHEVSYPSCMSHVHVFQNTLNQLLVEMDGFDTAKGVLPPRPTRTSLHLKMLHGNSNPYLDPNVWSCWRAPTVIHNT